MQINREQRKGKLGRERRAFPKIGKTSKEQKCQL
jgi:hypothetical protein